MSHKHMTSSVLHEVRCGPMGQLVIPMSLWPRFLEAQRIARAHLHLLILVNVRGVESLVQCRQ